MADMRALWFKGDDDREWQRVALHAVDAAHALEADPEHWKAEEPQPVPQDDPETEFES